MHCRTNKETGPAQIYMLQYYMKCKVFQVAFWPQFGYGKQLHTVCSRNAVTEATKIKVLFCTVEGQNLALYLILVYI